MNVFIRLFWETPYNKRCYFALCEAKKKILKNVLVRKLNKKIVVTLCMNYFSKFEIEKLLIESESIIRIYLFKIFFLLLE